MLNFELKQTIHQIANKFSIFYRSKYKIKNLYYKFAYLNNYFIKYIKYLFI